jgi:hypothetical protein
LFLLGGIVLTRRLSKSSRHWFVHLSLF